MIDDDLSRLARELGGRRLNRLESDIWAGIAAHNAARRTGRIIASCQVGVMIAALVGAAAAGATTVRVDRGPGSIMTSAGADFAPSTLLLGQRP